VYNHQKQQNRLHYLSIQKPAQVEHEQQNPSQSDENWPVQHDVLHTEGSHDNLV